MKAFNEPAFAQKGKHYTLPPEVPYRGYQLKDITLVPRPLHRPVETWQPMVSGAERGLDFMARHGIKGIMLGTAQQYIGAWMRRFQEANARHGRQLQLGENLALGLWCYLDTSYEKAKQALQPIFEEHVKFAAPLGMLRYNDAQMRATGPAGVATHIAAGSNFEEVLHNRAWFCGTPQDTVAYLQALQEQYPGLEHILIGFPMGLSTTQFKDQLILFAEEVIPVLKTAHVSA
jgi:alkanesulfonate monooxygenase SsuD/methylene tetrahydromethanopterin reductase-like flavin-dependent oxidoreductase (luciferase family)